LGIMTCRRSRAGSIIWLSKQNPSDLATSKGLAAPVKAVWHEPELLNCRKQFQIVS
jgi:hypothetical protein